MKRIYYNPCWLICSFQTCDRGWMLLLMWLYLSVLLHQLTFVANVSSSVNFILLHFCDLGSLSSFSFEIVFYVNKIGKSTLFYYFCSRCRDTKSWITLYFPNVLFRHVSNIEKSEYRLRHVSVYPSVHPRARTRL
jgi:hypothetical protein